ncbi:MAG: type ISP restriction/modification enzyme, partial [Candidatus Methylumidiphilus sp.]
MLKPAENLRAIQNFDQLIRYLEDELGWPLQEYGFDELTFEYSPEELGIKEQDAAKITQVHQLRPLYTGQPWGIFFVEFETKKLPVVVLRRILSHLVVKKRASANSATAAAWHTEDLLFISAFGEIASQQREIAFAHFHQEPGDLPSLRVLGWDGADTPLKLDHLDKTLRERLRWPDDKADQTAWREQWSRPFRHRIGHVIRTSDNLAEVLAELARTIRDRAQTMLAAEADNGPLRVLHKAFKTALIHDLSEDSFADTYAQTITYGLLTAAISKTDHSEGCQGTALIADNITDMVPITNPFLKEMLQTFLHVGGRKGGIDFDELGIQDVVELLRGEQTDLPAILRDFGNKTRGEDPVIHFYEHFLSAYNKKLKIQRGVFYTPQPVVSYIVRSVHELLQTEFGLEDGLASTVTWGEMAKKLVIPAGMPESSHKDVNLPTNNEPQIKTGTAGELPSMALGSGIPCRNDAQPTPFKIPEGNSPDSPFVVILDPATGTATFLVGVIDMIHKTLTEKWRKQGMKDKQREAAWNEYVPKHLLPRLYGYELMMAPYAIAHMKIGLKLHETGYLFGSDERARIYLTNALEPASDGKGQMEIEALAPALAHEAQAVNAVKQGQRFTVVVGNPPYSGHSSNNGAWIADLLRKKAVQSPGYFEVDGAPLGEKNPKWLNDDYVKFIRLAQVTIEQAHTGLLGYITNHGYLDNPTFRGMRQSLMHTFDSSYLFDLHGNSKKKEKTADGGKDENVFDIQQGVAIGIFIKYSGLLNPYEKGNKFEANGVSHAGLYGLRADKYRTLSAQGFAGTHWNSLSPSVPFILFSPQNETLSAEYEQGWKITDIMPVNSVGIVTARDALTIHWSSEEVWETVTDFAKLDVEKAREKYSLGKDAQDWKVGKAQADLNNSGPNHKNITTVLYRPFDVRYTYYTGKPSGFLCRPRSDVMQNFLDKNNVGLGISR